MLIIRFSTRAIFCQLVLVRTLSEPTSPIANNCSPSVEPTCDNMGAPWPKISKKSQEAPNRHSRPSSLLRRDRKKQLNDPTELPNAPRTFPEVRWFGTGFPVHQLLHDVPTSIREFCSVADLVILVLEASFWVHPCTLHHKGASSGSS